jgi:hypothetical protein
VQEAYLQLKELAEGFQQVSWLPVLADVRQSAVLRDDQPEQDIQACAAVLRQDMLKKVADEREQRDQQLFIKVCRSSNAHALDANGCQLLSN